MNDLTKTGKPNTGNVVCISSRSPDRQTFAEYWEECSEYGVISEKRARMVFAMSPEAYFRNAGWVYVLGHQCLRDNVFKIGRTTGRIERRMRQLCTTGVPGEFDCVYAHWFADCVDAESYMHSRLDEYRVEQNREFFEVGLTKVQTAFQEYACFGEIHPDHMINQAHNRFKEAARTEKVRGSLVVPPPSSLITDLGEVPF